MPTPPSGTGRRSPRPRPSATPPKTRADRLVNRAAGEKAAFLAKAASHATAARRLTEFRLLWDTLATSLPGRPKLILDRRAAGRRHLWLADPARVEPAASAAPLDDRFADGSMRDLRARRRPDD